MEAEVAEVVAKSPSVGAAVEAVPVVSAPEPAPADVSMTVATLNEDADAAKPDSAMEVLPLAATTAAVTEDVATTKHDSDVEGSNLHVSCRDFQKTPLEKVKTWLEKTSEVPLKKVFKLKAWGYAFVTVDDEIAPKFRAAVDGATFRSSVVSVKDGNPRSAKDGNHRDANSRKPKGAHDEEPDAKRQRIAKGFPEGHVPTLKDVISKQNAHKGAGIDKSIVEKSAPLLPWPYDVQLKMKDTYVKTAVRSFTKQVRAQSENFGTPVAWTTPEWCYAAKAPYGCGCPMESIIGTPAESLTGYRNKCEFTIGENADGEIEVGFVLKITAEGGQVIASAADLPHVPPVMNRLCSVLRDHVRASQFQVFDRRRNKKSGVWRLAMARLATTGDMMVMVQIASLDEENQQRLVKALIADLVGADLRIVSIYLQFNDGVSDAGSPDAKLIHIHGRERLEMPLLGLRFDLGPMSFFQTNSVTVAALYERAISWLRPAGQLVLDICCGVGTIGLCAARHCRNVVGIELVPEAVESAKQNAALNGIENASFHAGKAEHVLPNLLEEELRRAGADVEVCAMVDPPRAGLHKDVLQALRECSQLSRIVYISCNPESLAEDVVKLCMPGRDGEDPLVPVRAVAVDMFPHTLHCEMILLMERSSKVADPRAVAPSAAAADAVADPATGIVSSVDTGTKAPLDEVSLQEPSKGEDRSGHEDKPTEP